MEGAGIYAAAAPEKVDWIVAKAIADWGYDKTDEVQRMAADNVADFVVHAIRSGALDEAVVPVNAR
jgi:nucleoside phosphorylase